MSKIKDAIIGIEELYIKNRQEIDRDTMYWIFDVIAYLREEEERERGRKGTSN